MSRIPKPDEVASHFAAEQRRKIESLRNRVIEHLRSHGDQHQHRLALHGTDDSVVSAIIAECEESGWLVKRARRAPKYGPPVSENGKVTIPLLEDGEDDLVLERP